MALSQDIIKHLDELAQTVPLSQEAKQAAFL
jgi:hypothetical protein